MNWGNKRRYARGYPVAVLVGFEEKRAVLWRIFSKVVKPDVTVELKGEDRRQLYDFHESVVDALRPALKEGVRSIVLVAPMKTDYAKGFFDHVRKHHAWLFRSDGPSTATFGELVGFAGRLDEVLELVKTQDFRKVVDETTSGDADRIVEVLEKSLGENVDGTALLYSREEIEKLIIGERNPSSPRPQHLILTNKYLAETKEKGRAQRLLQISKNRNVKTTVIKVESKAGVRLSQLGGIVCITEPRKK